MARTLIVKPLGLVLQKAGLVSPEQVQLALEERLSLPERKIGEIMAIKGWIEQQTADFFAEQWPQLLAQKQQQPLGQYLKAAGLINDEQIEIILREQNSNGVRFGASAVIKGLISQKTLDFFLEQLYLSNVQARVITSNSLFLEKKPEHLRRIETFILHNAQCEPSILLKQYQQIWRQKTIVATGSRAEEVLLKSGLVIKQDRQIKLERSPLVKIFDNDWIEQQLARLQPYNKIRLRFFGLETKASLPYKVLSEVSNWTNAHPLLTQKVYQLIRERESFIFRGQESERIEELIQQYLIDDWETGIAAAHFQDLTSALSKCQECSRSALLKAYKKVWQQGRIPPDDSPEQAYLLKIGLIRQEENQIMVANRIYQAVFDRTWVEKQLAIANHAIVLVARKNQNPPTVAISATNSSLEMENKNRSKIAGGLLILLLSGSAIAIGINLATKYRQLKQFQQANQLWQQQQYERAIAIYDRLLQTNGGNRARVWINRGYALAGLKQYNAMLQSCSSATLVRPEAALAWNCQGEALYHLQRYRAAIKAFDKAIALNSQEATFWINKSESLSKLDQDQAVDDASERAIELLERKPNNTISPIDRRNLSIAYNQRGESLLKQKNYTQALQAFEKSLTAAPDYLSAQQGKGIALYQLKQYAAANTVFEEILQREDILEAQKSMTWLYKGINLCDANQLEAAEQAFKQVLGLKSNPQTRAIAEAGCGIR